MLSITAGRIGYIFVESLRKKLVMSWSVNEIVFICLKGYIHCSH
jgi:hypothetical protein